MDLLPSHMQQVRTVLFSPSPPDLALVGAWKACLKWEESNPLQIKEKDKACLITRIQYYPEIWFMAYSWTASVAKDAKEALTVLKANPFR